MTLFIKLNGVEYENFVSASVFTSMETAGSAFEFTSTANKLNAFPIKVGDSVQISADGENILNGYVERLDVSYSYDSHEIKVAGRNILADLIDSSVGETKEFQGNISLASIAETIIRDLGLSASGVKVIDQTPLVMANFEEFELTSADVGDNAFDFLESYARKRQVFLNSDADGNLILTQASSEVFGFALKNVVGANDNNILQGRASWDFSERFNQYVVQSQLNTSSLFAQAINQEVVNQSGSASDSDIRATRVLEFNAEESSDSLTSEQRAIWESNIRRARSLDYTAKVQGHTVLFENSNYLWTTNVLVNVSDDFCNINSQLRVKAVRYNYGLDSGSTTDVIMTFKDAYTLQAEQDSREVGTTEQGSAFWEAVS